MSMGFGYVSPEQVMRDRADYARKGIARGRALAAITYDQGVCICAENPSRSLHKVSEIYDRIAFAAAGRYNEYDSLRQAGVRLADVKGFTYSREDVDARSLANAYAQTLGQVFTHEMKPMEVEILVAGLGLSADDDELYHILYDGTVVDETHFTVLGGEAETIIERLQANYRDGLTLGEAVKTVTSALSGPDRQLGASDLEVAVLSRSNGRRAFERVANGRLAELLG